MNDRPPSATDPLLNAARILAWMPWANFGGRSAHRYRERLEARDILVALLGDAPLTTLPPDLAKCIRRAAAASYVNRRGLPYYERREAIRQLRVALDHYDRVALAFRRR